MQDHTSDFELKSHKILRVGHRGAKGYAPENTLASFRKALELKVDMFELDVRLCRSGELVVLHDETVDRTTDGSGAAGELTLSRLKKLDAGQGEKIPTLEEVLELAAGKCGINIELKVENTEQPVAGIIARSVAAGVWTYGHFLISSFDHDKLRRIGALDPRIRIGPLVTDIPGDFLKTARELRAWSVHVAKEYLNSGKVKEFHEAGLKVIAYTAYSSTEIGRLKALGADGIVSDYPDRI